MSDTFIHELPLEVTHSSTSALHTRFDTGGMLYNAILSESLRCLQLMKEFKEWTLAKHLPRGEERTALFKKAIKKQRFTEYAIHHFLTEFLKRFPQKEQDAIRKALLERFRSCYELVKNCSDPEVREIKQWLQQVSDPSAIPAENLTGNEPVKGFGGLDPTGKNNGAAPDGPGTNEATFVEKSTEDLPVTLLASEGSGSSEITDETDKMKLQAINRCLGRNENDEVTAADIDLAIVKTANLIAEKIKIMWDNLEAFMPVIDKTLDPEKQCLLIIDSKEMGKNFDLFIKKVAQLACGITYTPDMTGRSH